jgi:polar amino acid transport system substrate-binding protein
VADAADTGAWTIALIGADPVRARRIGFTAPYVEIESTYLVPPGSSLVTPEDVDQPGQTIAAFTGSAYELWLRRKLKHATLVAATNIEDSLNRCRDGRLSALAGLRSRLVMDRESWPGSRVLDTNFMKVQQAVGTQKDNAAGLAYLQGFVEKVKAEGLVASLIARHKADGLSVAPRT